MAVTGLNHITLAVCDLDRSLRFYREILGFAVRAVWEEGAYLEAGDLWLCLSRDENASAERYADYTHVALSVSPENFGALCRAIEANAAIWKTNRSEGESLYFLDPDGHKLEIHMGSLATRLKHYREHPEKGVKILDQ